MVVNTAALEELVKQTTKRIKLEAQLPSSRSQTLQNSGRQVDSEGPDVASITPRRSSRLGPGPGKNSEPLTPSPNTVKPTNYGLSTNRDSVSHSPETDSEDDEVIVEESPTPSTLATSRKRKRTEHAPTDIGPEETVRCNQSHEPSFLLIMYNLH